MAQLKGCPYCKGNHRTKRAFLRCARSKGPKPMWQRLTKGN